MRGGSQVVRLPDRQSMRRRGFFRRALPLLLARGAVVLTLCWVVFLGVAAAAGLHRILPTHRTHVVAAGPSPVTISPTPSPQPEGGRSGGSAPNRGGPPPNLSGRAGGLGFQGSPLPPGQWP